MLQRNLLTVCLFTIIGVPAFAQTTREVTHHPRSVVEVHAKLRFTTMIILPEHEEILDFICGDKDFWIVSGTQNLAYVKPAKAGATTNLNLVTSSGTVYSFLLTEGAGNPDLKLYVALDATTQTTKSLQPFYSAAHVEGFRREAEDARREAAVARDEMATARAVAAKSIEDGISRFRASYPMQLRFPYRFKRNEKPFSVSAIFHDGRFTYIRSDAAELPSLYEVRDRAPNLVNFQVENGVYIVPKVLENGYLTIGKQKFAFIRERE